MMSQKSFQGILFLLIGLIAVLIGVGIPVHMDEFINFHPLAYGQPNFHLTHFSEGFEAYLKKGPWGISTPFPFPYTGNLQAALFYPFYVLFPLLWAKIGYGILSLYVIFWSFFRSIKLTRSAKIFLVCFFPLYVSVMHDGGPVNVAILVFLWTKIWIEKLYLSPSKVKKGLFAGLLALIWAIAFYDKIFFLYIWPAALVFAFAHMGFSQIRQKSSLFLIGSIGLFFIFVQVFMRYEICAVDFNTVELAQHCLPESQFLGGGDGPMLVAFLKQCYHGNFSLELLQGIFEDRNTVFWVLLHQFDFSFYLLRNIDYFSFFQVQLFGLRPFFAWALVFVALVFFVKNPRLYLHNRYLISFFTMAFVFLALGKVRFGHHAIFLWIPLLGFLTEGLHPPGKKWLWKGFMGLNAVFLIGNIIFGQPHEAIKEGYGRIAEGTQRHDIPRAIVNFDDWNYYYIRSLDNERNDIVTWVKPDQVVASKRLFALSDSLGLPIVYVGSQQKPLPIPIGFTKRIIQPSKNNPIYLISGSNAPK
jgi:hypothetical protein